MLRIIKIILLMLICSIPIIIRSQTVVYPLWDRYFVPADGKIVGVWPTDARLYNVDSLKVLKNKFGFNYIFTSPSQFAYNIVRDAGFQDDHIMFGVTPTNYTVPYEAVDDIHAVDDNLEEIVPTRPPSPYAFYNDEPCYYVPNRGRIELDDFNDMCDDIHARYPNSKVITGNWYITTNPHCFTFDYAFNDYTIKPDIVMCSGYKTIWGACGIMEDADQRDYWTAFRNTYPDKFKLSWVAAHQDLSGYWSLWGHANNLGLLGLWFYQASLCQANGFEDANDNIWQYSICGALNGSLRPFNQLYYYRFNNGELVKKYKWGNPREGGLTPSIGNTAYFGCNDVLWYNEISSSNFTIDDKIVDNGTFDDYYSNHLLTANNFVVPDRRNASLNSDTKVVLEPGFHAARGSNFIAYIQTGVNGDSYGFPLFLHGYPSLPKTNNSLNNPQNKGTDITNKISVPDQFSLAQNFPNPFNPITTIRYDIPAACDVKIVVYDIMGKEIKTLVNEFKSPGYYQIKFDGSSLSSGIYFYRINAGSFTSIKKLMLVK